MPQGSDDSVDFSRDEVVTKFVPNTVGFSPETVKPLSEVFPDAGSKFLKLTEVVYEDIYMISPCPDGGGNSVVLSYRTGELADHLDVDPLDVIAVWEPEIFNDMGASIFPGISLSQPQALEFNQRVGKPHRAAYFAVDGQELSIFNNSRLNYVFYSPSVRCLEFTMDMVYDND